MAERPATLARFLVTKHSWRGRYRRILGVAEDGLYTVNPITFETTNAWSYASDLVGVGASDGSDEDFFLALTHDPDGLIKLSFGTHKKLWSCEHRAELLTAIQRARAAAASKAPPRSRGQLGADPSLACLRMPAARIECVAPDGTPVWTELSLVATAVALEIRDPASDELLDDLPYASLRGFCAFSDLHGGFLVQRKRRPRAEAFRCAQLPELLRHVLSALPRLGVALALGQGLPVPAVAAAASAARVGATPPTLLAVWCSARAADDASYRPHQLRCEAYRHTPLGPLSVTLLVSEDELIERELNASAVRAAFPLSELAALVRPPHSATRACLVLACAGGDVRAGSCQCVEYECTARDELLDALIDAALAAGHGHVPVHESQPLELRAARLTPWAVRSCAEADSACVRALADERESLPPSAELHALLHALAANAAADGVHAGALPKQPRTLASALSRAATHSECALPGARSLSLLCLHRLLAPLDPAVPLLAPLPAVLRAEVAPAVWRALGTADLAAQLSAAQLLRVLCALACADDGGEPAAADGALADGSGAQWVGAAGAEAGARADDGAAAADGAEPSGGFRADGAVGRPPGAAPFAEGGMRPPAGTADDEGEEERERRRREQHQAEARARARAQAQQAQLQLQAQQAHAHAQQMRAQRRRRAVALGGSRAACAGMAAAVGLAGEHLRAGTAAPVVRALILCFAHLLAAAPEYDHAAAAAARRRRRAGAAAAAADVQAGAGGELGAADGAGGSLGQPNGVSHAGALAPPGASAHGAGRPAPDEVQQAALRALSVLDAPFFRCLAHRSLAVRRGALLLLHALGLGLARPAWDSVRARALSEGAILQQLLAAAFTRGDDRAAAGGRECARLAVAALATGHADTLDVLRRALPGALLRTLSTPAWRGRAPAAAEWWGGAGSDGDGGDAAYDPAAARFGAGGPLPLKPALPGGNGGAERGGEAARAAWLEFALDGSHRLRRRAADEGAAAASFVAAHTSTPEGGGPQPAAAAVPSGASGGAGGASADALAAASEAAAAAAVGSNWEAFFEALGRDHAAPDLLWNGATRDELRDALRAEAESLADAQRRAHGAGAGAAAEGGAPAGGAEGAAAANAGAGGRVVWNWPEFEVRYERSLGRELRVGEIVLRLLLSAGNRTRVVLHNPGRFFDCLYRRLLTEPSVRVRLLCVEGMRTAYAAYGRQIGPFADTAHLVRLLREAEDGALRDRLIELLAECLAVRHNAAPFLRAHGAQLCVGLLSLVHLSNDRPAHSHLIAAGMLLTARSDAAVRAQTAEWHVLRAPAARRARDGGGGEGEGAATRDGDAGAGLADGGADGEGSEHEGEQQPAPVGGPATSLEGPAGKVEGPYTLDELCALLNAVRAQHGGTGADVDARALASLDSDAPPLPAQRPSLLNGGGGGGGGRADGEEGADAGADGAPCLPPLRAVFGSGGGRVPLRCWAQGMAGWRLPQAIAPLKWHLLAAEGAQGSMHFRALGCALLELLRRLVDEGASPLPAAHAAGGAAGGAAEGARVVLHPMPAAKRLLSEPDQLPHLAQLLICGEPSVVERAASLLHSVVAVGGNPVCAQLYETGAFFFCLMYTGSNLRPIARLLAATHRCQRWRDGGYGEGEGEGAGVPLTDDEQAGRPPSVLSPLLPAALIAILDEEGPDRFAQVLLGECDTPASIWGHRMRRQMVERIALHLGDFLVRLRSNPLALYEYCPIPPVCYPELADELFCHRFYLRHLCDETRFGSWPIAQPVALMRSVLERWAAELRRKPSSLTRAQALEALELDPEQPIEQADPALRRAYLRLASLYHPDKSEGTREQFERVRAAYELASTPGALHSGPDACRLELLLRTQVILYTRCAQAMAPLQYPAYPLALRTLEHISTPAERLLSAEGTRVLVPLSALLRLSVTVSPPNCHELARAGGLEQVAWLLRRALSQLTLESPADCPPALVAADALHVVAAAAAASPALCHSLATAEPLRTCVADAARALQLRQMSGLLEAALEAAGALCASADAQAALTACGGGLLLLRLCLQYDFTVEGEERAAQQEASAQLRANAHAVLAVRTLRALCGYARGPAAGAPQPELHGGLSLAAIGGGGADGGARTPPNPPCCASLGALLPAALGAALADGSAAEVLLRALNSSTRTPCLVWNGRTRAQLAKLLADAAAALWRGAEGFDPLALSAAFRYAELEGELVLGGLYVRVYTEQPDCRLANPRLFARALLDFATAHVPAAAQGGWASEPQARDGAQPAAEQQPAPPAQRAQAELCLALDALRLLLRRVGEVEAELLSRRRLDSVLRLLAPRAPLDVASRALACAQALSSSAACVDALAAVPAVWAPHAVLLLHERPSLALGALRLLRALAAAPDAVGALLSQGAHLFALALLLAPPAAEPREGGALLGPAGAHGADADAADAAAAAAAAALAPAERRRVREGACALLGRMAADKAHGDGVAMACARLLPPVFVETMAETAAAAAADAPPSAAAAALAGSADGGELDGGGGAPSAALRLLDSCHDNPELIWNGAMRAELLRSVRAACEQLAAAARAEAPPPPIARAPPVVSYAEVEGLLCLGGVWLGRYLHSPGWALRRPGRFLEALLREWDLIVPAAAAAAAQPANADAGALVVRSLRARPSPLGGGDAGASALPSRGATVGEWGDVCDALVLLLHAEPALARELAAMGAAERFTSQCAHADLRVQRTAVSLTAALAGSAAGLQALRRYDSVAQLSAAVGARCERAEAVLAALTKMAAVADLAGQAVRCGLPSLCASLLDGGAAAYAEPQAVRAHAVLLLRALEADLAHGEQVRAAIEGSAGWAQARSQSVELLVHADPTGQRLLERRGSARQGLLAHTATNAAAVSRPPPTSAADAAAAAAAAASASAAALALKAVPRRFDDDPRTPQPQPQPQPRAHASPLPPAPPQQPASSAGWHAEPAALGSAANGAPSEPSGQLGARPSPSPQPLPARSDQADGAPAAAEPAAGVGASGGPLGGGGLGGDAAAFRGEQFGACSSGGPHHAATDAAEPKLGASAKGEGGQARPHDFGPLGPLGGAD